MNFIVIPNVVRNLVLPIEDKTEISLPTNNVGIEMTMIRYFKMESNQTVNDKPLTANSQ